MTCSQCGSNLPCRCTPCTDTSPDACCQPSIPATPLPFYACAPACPENHKQTITIQQFYTTINIAESWNIPDCEESAIITSIGVKAALPGSYIWNETYGYFEVTAFNAATGQLTIVNHCNDGNAAPGTNVPACTEFLVTAPPCECPNTDLSCVAIDFTAPAVGVCIPITLTNLDSIQASDEIQIGAGRYRVQSIDGPFIITICNDGLGLIPGTAVIAKDGAGNYQYCITVVGTCCSRIEDEFGGDLTPCSDFENETVSPNAFSIVEPGPNTIDAGTTTHDSNTLVVAFNNASTCRDMKGTLTVQIMFSSILGGTTGINLVTYSLLESTDAGPYSIVLTGYDSWAGADGIDTAFFRNFVFPTVMAVPAGTTVTKAYVFRSVIAASGDGSAVFTNMQLHGAGLGVAV